MAITQDQKDELEELLQQKENDFDMKPIANYGTQGEALSFSDGFGDAIKGEEKKAFDSIEAKWAYARGYGFGSQLRIMADAWASEPKKGKKGERA